MRKKNEKNERLQEVINEMLEKYKEEITFCIDECKSPIEEIMCVALRDMLMRDVFLGEIEIIDVIPQYEIKIGKKKKYIADFLVGFAFKHNNKYKECLNIIIECDGHEFHEKTKEQVENDNKRDRDIMREGYYVFHFSGSEIYKDPFYCVEEIKRFVVKQYNEYLDKKAKND